MILFIVASFVLSWLMLRLYFNCNSANNKVSTMVVLGSGGHSAEIIQLMKGVIKNSGSKYSPRIYVVANTDKLSQEKIESLISLDDLFLIVPRSREVGQSWISTVLTTFYASLFSSVYVFYYKPRLIICNGPGTCVPIVYSAIFFRWFLLTLDKPKVVFVESFARVENLSLSGKLIYPVCDLFIVQWEKLAKKYPKSIHLDNLL